MQGRDSAVQRSTINEAAPHQAAPAGDRPEKGQQQVTRTPDPAAGGPVGELFPGPGQLRPRPGNGLPVQRDYRQPTPPGRQDHEIQTVKNRPGWASGRPRSRTIPSLTLVTRTRTENRCQSSAPAPAAQGRVEPGRAVSGQPRGPLAAPHPPPSVASGHERRAASEHRPQLPHRREPALQSGEFTRKVRSRRHRRTSPSRHEASTSITCNGLVDTPRKWPTIPLTPPARERPECPFGAQ